MEPARPQNLIEVDNLVDDFLQRNSQGIITVHRIYFKSEDSISLRALLEELKDELRTGCVTFINKNHPMSGLDAYLFYIVNDSCKKKAAPNHKKKTEYLCPACLFFGKENLIFITNQLFTCEDCAAELKLTQDPKKISLFKTFAKHNKAGCRCKDCERFIPYPMDNSSTIVCPYLDCTFVGDVSELRRMHHPNSESNIELLTLDSSFQQGKTFKDNVIAQQASALDKLEIQGELEKELKVLLDVIETQSNSIPYVSSDFTVKHKISAYKSFANILSKYPEEMVAYMLHSSRSGGFQHKLFQEYVRIIEESLPFFFQKNKTKYKVESLLDENLNIFDGISTFEEMVNEHSVIKNSTKEFYIGGRKATITQPYYIGKLLSLVDKKTKNSLMDHVVDYSFSRIKVRDIVPGTEVLVTHLRVPPHYQMGGMVHINRIKEKIVERAKYILDKKDND
jgi:hypothetical protein